MISAYYAPYNGNSERIRDGGFFGGGEEYIIYSEGLQLEGNLFCQVVSTDVWEYNEIVQEKIMGSFRYPEWIKIVTICLETMTMSNTWFVYKYIYIYTRMRNKYKFKSAFWLMVYDQGSQTVCHGTLFNQLNGEWVYYYTPGCCGTQSGKLLGMLWTEKVYDKKTGN